MDSLMRLMAICNLCYKNSRNKANYPECLICRKLVNEYSLQKYIFYLRKCFEGLIIFNLRKEMPFRARARARNRNRFGKNSEKREVFVIYFS
jgi:hypothetical protein